MTRTPPPAEPLRVASPDGRLTVHFRLDEEGAPRYSVLLDGQPVMAESRLGLVREDADFSRGLRLAGASPAEAVRDRYEILTSKRRVNEYAANRRVFHLRDAQDRPMDVVFQLSDDGVAFRYRFPDHSDKVHRLREERSSFRFLPGTRAWMQPIAEAKSGWERTNPSYEEYYERDVPVGTPSPTGAGWVYPALFRSGDRWLLVSEAALSRRYAGTRLRSDAPDGEYTVGFPDPREHFQGGPVNPEATLPWETPWRLIVVGDLKTVAESTLGTDLADPPARAAGPRIAPGKASWSWPLLGDPNTTFEVQKRFIDYAAEMGWKYTLIDALWDRQIGYDRVRELVEHARGRGVELLLWYNSAGGWNGTPQTPRDLLLTRESRRREFQRVSEMGIAGLKVDFFGGDGQSVIEYYHDIMEDAGEFGLLLNFHGATLPRGWHRTYPHLMTVEAVRGLEFVTFEQSNADAAPAHMAMLPFTRNVFDPMDFTPVVLDRIRNIQRRTSSAFELATSVLFTSGIQHYAEIPEGMAKAPGYVRDFLRAVPDAWEDTRFLAGHPGEFAVLARRGGGRWHVAGINAQGTPRTVQLDVSALTAAGRGTLITDGEGGNLSFRREQLQAGPDGQLSLTLAPRGGFVLVLE